jgi:hypothetical protein
VCVLRLPFRVEHVPQEQSNLPCNTAQRSNLFVQDMRFLMNQLFSGFEATGTFVSSGRKLLGGESTHLLLHCPHITHGGHLFISFPQKEKMSFRGGPGGGGAGNGAGGPRVKKVMTQAINLIFEFLQKVTNFANSIYSNLMFFSSPLSREIVFKFGYMKIPQ